MSILFYVICGAVIGWGIGQMAILAIILANDLWGVIAGWVSGLRSRLTCRRQWREGMPPEYEELAARMAEGSRLINAAMPTMCDASNALELMSRL